MVRRDWSCWTISLAPPRLIHDHPEGLAEPRSFVKCPICLEQINVAAATAMKNRSLTGRNHLKKCPGQSPVCELTAPTTTTTEDEMVLPPSKRPRGKAMSEMSDSFAAMQQQMNKNTTQTPTESGPEHTAPKHKSTPFKGVSSTPPVENEIVTIYALVYIPTGKRVYTGRTKDPDRRLGQHASKGSKCRLVKNAFRKHGRKSFALEPIMRCRDSDGDANESFWIIQNKTLYPDGYNLRHGSMAGEDDVLATALVPTCTGVVPFNGLADEVRACAEGWESVAEIVEGLDDSANDADDLCKDLLRQVHPDAHGGESRVYTAGDVSAMLNAVREVVAIAQAPANYRNCAAD